MPDHAPSDELHLRMIEFEGMVLGRHLAPGHTAGGRLALDRSHYTLLSRLGLEGPLSTSELSDAFGLDVSTVHRQTSAMLHQGLVERIPDPEGGIARKFRVSDDGREALDADRAVRLSALSDALADWTSDDIARLADLLSRFNVDLERRDGRPWPRK